MIKKKYGMKLSVKKSWWRTWNTFPTIIFVNLISLIASCAFSRALNPCWTVSVDFIAASTLQIWTLWTLYALRLIRVECNTEWFITKFLDTFTVLYPKTFNTACAFSVYVCSCTVPWKFLTSSVDIEIKSGKAVDAYSVFSVTLTINIHVWSHSLVSSLWTNSCVTSGSWIIEIITLLWLFNTSAIDGLVRLVSISFLAISAVALIIPLGAMLHDFNTYVFPLGAAFKTLFTSARLFIEIFAVELVIPPDIFLEHPCSLARYIDWENK